MIYLGFDCATKTFAWSISEIKIDEFRAKEAIYLQKLAVFRAIINKKDNPRAGESQVPQKQIDELVAHADRLNKELASYITVREGDMVDLFPDRSDKQIEVVERVQAAANYVKNIVKPRAGANKVEKVFIEFQMGVNSRSDAVAIALMALFSELPTILVGPSYKNTICVHPAIHYSVFAAKYAKSYSANKAHAIETFAEVLRLFPNTLGAIPRNKIGHIADSFLQILGYERMQLTHH